MKKVLSLILSAALVLTTVFAMPVTAQAATGIDCTQNIYYVDSYNELEQALTVNNDQNKTVILTGDINTGWGTSEIKQDYQININSNKCIVLDFAGHKITVPSYDTQYIFNLQGSGDVYFIDSENSDDASINMEFTTSYASYNDPGINHSAVYVNNDEFYSYGVDYYIGKDDSETWEENPIVNPITCAAVFINYGDIKISDCGMYNYYSKGACIGGIEPRCQNGVIVDDVTMSAGYIPICIRNMEYMGLEMYDATLQSTTGNQVICDTTRNRSLPTYVLGINKADTANGDKYTAVRKTRTGSNLMLSSLSGTNDARLKGTVYFVTGKTDQSYTATKVVLPQGHLQYFDETSGYEKILPHSFAITAEGAVKCKSCYATANVSITVPDVVYNGSAQTPSPKVVMQFADGSYELEKTSAEYVNNKNAGKATVKVTLKTEEMRCLTVSGSISKDFNISKVQLDAAKVSLAQTSFDYDGKAKTPAVTVTGLKSGVDYDISYSNNVNVGTATVTITGKGNYTGTVTKNFTIKDAAKPEVEKGIIRLAGSDRFSTSAEISKGFIAKDKADAILIVNGLNFADALAATPFSAEIGAPILMINGPAGTFTPEVKAEIDRIDSNHDAAIYIIGGTGAVNQKAETTLREYGYKNIKRVAGSDRFKTAIEVAKMRNNEKTAYIANGLNFPDALGGGSAAALNDGVILFTLTGSLNADTKAFIQSQGYDNIVILGGTGAVSQSVENELRGIAKVKRVYGSNRYTTSAAVAKEYFPKADTVIVATGMNFADALAGGPLAAEKKAPILLVNPYVQTIDVEIKQYIKDCGAKQIYVLGGKSAVSESLYKDLESLVK